MVRYIQILKFWICPVWTDFQSLIDSKAAKRVSTSQLFNLFLFLLRIKKMPVDMVMEGDITMDITCANDIPSIDLSLPLQKVKSHLP